MSSRPGGRRVVVFALLFASLMLLPAVVADHAYSHRYIIYGRVVDAVGNPVQGLTVDLRPDPLTFEAEGACNADQPGTASEAFGKTFTKPVTNEFGEWTYCFHTHGMSRTLPPTAKITVQGTNFSMDLTFDPYFRTSYVPIKLSETRADANTAILNSTYTVQGRLWRPVSGDTFVDTIKVYGDVLEQAPVNVTLTLDDGTTILGNTTTNNYGDYSLRLSVPKRVTSGTLTIVSGDETIQATIDPIFGTTAVKAELAKEYDPFLRNMLIGVGIVAAIALIGGAGWWSVRRMQAKREDDTARARSTRKRANR